MNGIAQYVRQRRLHEYHFHSRLLDGCTIRVGMIILDANH